MPRIPRRRLTPGRRELPPASCQLFGTFLIGHELPAPVGDVFLLISIWPNPDLQFKILVLTFDVSPREKRFAMDAEPAPRGQVVVSSTVDLFGTGLTAVFSVDT